MQRYPTGATPPYREDVCQQVRYTYDTNPVNANFSQYSAGRLTTVQYYGQNPNSTGQGCGQNSNGYYPYAYDTYTEMYSYVAAGAVTAKNVALTRAPGNYSVPYSPASLEVDYTYDSAGRNTNVTYPMAFQNSNSAQPVLTMGYDSMGRPSTLTDGGGDPGTYGSSAPTNWVSGVHYDFAGRLTSVSWLAELAAGYGTNSTSETRSYNVNGQLASIGWGGYITPGNLVQIQYSYSATQNNGQITQEVDSYNGIGTQTTSYQYDALQHLTSATAQSSGSWPSPYTQTFQYDGFGNLTQKVLNGTTTPIAVNSATNQLTIAYCDANGNMTSGAGATFTYDEANRVATVTETSGGQMSYGYDASNKRIYQNASGSETFTFFGAKGENLGKYGITYGSGYPNCPSYGFCFQPQVTNLYFAGRLVTTTKSSGQPSPVFQDRLGTNRATGNYYPFGDGAAGTDSVQFATYTRDSYSGLDYADQRFYASTYGRFLTADQKAGDTSDPVSMNRYTYTGGDPVNRIDPQGTDWIIVNGGWCSTLDPSGGCYNPGYGDSFAGGGGASCASFDPNLISALAQTPQAPTFAAQLAAMGCGPGSFSAPVIPAAAPDCNAITAAVGFSGLTYSNATEIWNDLAKTKGIDNVADAALGVVTWAGESSFSLRPINNGNSNGSVDIGPFQLNYQIWKSGIPANQLGSVFGTNVLAGQVFNGNPDANIVAGLQYLVYLYGKFGDQAAGLYTGRNNPNRGARQATFDMYSTQLETLFSNTYCFPNK